MYVGPTRSARSFALAVVCALAGCAVGPDYVPQPPPAGTDYGVPGVGRVGPADTTYVTYVDATQVPAQWWNQFGSGELDSMVVEALQRSPSLAAAQSRLRQSESSRRAGYGLYMPQVGVDANAVRERSAPLRLGSQDPGSVFNVFTISGSVGYVLDLFGGQRRRVEALGAQADEARENARATYLALTANVVGAAISRAAYARQAERTRALIGAARSQEQLTNVRYLAGAAGYPDVAALRAEVAALEATLPALELREEQAAHLLAVLCGHAPSEWQPPVVDLDAYRMPDQLPIIVPSALVRQRPDIRAAEARLHQSSANVGVATADLFPAVSISGAAGSAASALAGLGGSHGRFWSDGADVSVPLFQGGTLWYTRRAAQHAYEASLQEYRQVVLLALDQVADSLRALDHDAQAVSASARAAAAAQLSRELAQTNYQAGVADYLAVLVALRGEYSAQLAYAQAVAQRLQDAVVLFVALGGDWSAVPRGVVEGKG